MFGINKRSRYNYWSCSDLADCIRGTDKPKALPIDDWDAWNEETKKKSPFRYWASEVFLDFFQDLINLPLDIIYTIRIYVKNRWIDKIQYLKTGLEPGVYYDLDHRILHGLFNELVDFVEIEYAQLSISDSKKEYKFVKGRCAEAGLDHLDWASNLMHKNQLTNQAISAIEVLKLYKWWKNRDKRENPYDLYDEEKDGEFYYKIIDNIEQDYEQEDTDMLIRLIKIRDSLWT